MQEQNFLVKLGQLSLVVYYLLISPLYGLQLLIRQQFVRKGFDFTLYLLLLIQDDLHEPSGCFLHQSKIVLGICEFLNHIAHLLVQALFAIVGV